MSRKDTPTPPPLHEDDLDHLLQSLADIDVPNGLAERVMAAAPTKPVTLTERPLFWNRFFKPLFAGPCLAASLIVGFTVGYASAGTTDASTEDTSSFEFAFEDDTDWIADYVDEAPS